METEITEDMDIPLMCTLCQLTMESQFVKICSHRFLPVPLCIICSESFDSKWEESILNDDKDICSWCGEVDCGELLLCGDGSLCQHSFCKSEMP